MARTQVLKVAAWCFTVQNIRVVALSGKDNMVRKVAINAAGVAEEALSPEQDDAMSSTSGNEDDIMVRSVAINAAGVPELAVVTGAVPSECHPHIQWSATYGKNYPQWFGTMSSITGVSMQDGTYEDYQRWFKCTSTHKDKCNDKGLQFPTTCSCPPCDGCSGVCFPTSSPASTGFVPPDCRPHIQWSASWGKNFPQWFGSLRDITGVDMQDGTFEDYQRWFKCVGNHKTVCNDKGLQFPLTCSCPPCDGCSGVCFPTSEPTPPPTPAPSTAAPTLQPTPAPSPAPTESPTFSPTEATEAPTESPTLSPTEATEAPTESPTESPTKAPTEIPTAAPTPTPYSPGMAGAPWTAHEVLIVKAKLSRLFDVDQAWGIVNEWVALHPNAPRPNIVNRPAPLLLRLGFHDCLRYADGTGGCDGCLNLDGSEGSLNGPWYQLQLETDRTPPHNGLEHIVKILEEMYTNPSFPSKAPTLAKSLQSSGKSRADLWALATIVAVEYGIETNNGVCDDSSFERPEGYAPPQNRWDWARFDPSNGGAHCSHMQGEYGCRVELPKAMAFRTGRRDCVPEEGTGYITRKKERHPDPQTNGRGTVEFFRRDFGFSGRETVAIMGAHTMGRPHQSVSMLPYVWIKSGGQQFNNQYFRNLAGKPDWFFVHNQGSKYGCTRQGDAWGKKPEARWLANARLHLKTGGPTFWIQEKLICSEVCIRDDAQPADTACCNGRPAGAMCHPDGNRANTSVASESDPTPDSGCEKYHFHTGLDECMLNAEMGLYKDFQVDDNGIPYGCPGLETFNLDTWKRHWSPGTTFQSHWSTINGRRAEPECEKNMHAEPLGATPLHEIVDDYAENQDHWVRDFAIAFEKMLSNGYARDELEPGPDQWAGVKCPRNYPESATQYWACWSSKGLLAPIFIVSQLDGRVLQLNEATGLAEVATKRAAASNQMWHWTADNDMLINSFSQTPLTVGNLGTWSWFSREGANGKWHVLASTDSAGNAKVLDRGWSQVDGTHVTVWTEHGAVNQQWSAELAPTQAPTLAPPTPAPSEKPTARPTTLSPTSVPTEKTTPAPTAWTGFVPPECRPHIQWSANWGYRYPQWFRTMPDITGVEMQNGTFEDYQRWFKCVHNHRAVCGDKGLEFPLTCTCPPCNECTGTCASR